MRNYIVFLSLTKIQRHLGIQPRKHFLFYPRKMKIKMNGSSFGISRCFCTSKVYVFMNVTVL